jgi:Flp pilus assembly protein TadG
MPVSLINRCARRVVIRARAKTIRTLCAFRDQTEGVAAVEFALILPIMALMFIGSVEMSQAVSIDRRTSQVAASVGDIIARADGSILEKEVLDIAKIGSWLVKPYDTTKLKLEISVVQAPACPTSPCTSTLGTSDSGIKTKWKCTYDSNSPNALPCTCPWTVTTMPSAGLLAYGDSVVVSKAEYAYTPLVFDYFMKQAQSSAGGVYKLKEQNILKGRGALIKLMEPSPSTSEKCPPP